MARLCKAGSAPLRPYIKSSRQWIVNPRIHGAAPPRFVLLEPPVNRLREALHAMLVGPIQLDGRDGMLAGACADRAGFVAGGLRTARLGRDLPAPSGVGFAAISADRKPDMPKKAYFTGRRAPRSHLIQ
jgi:hypothetical protein